VKPADASVPGAVSTGLYLTEERNGCAARLTNRMIDRNGFVVLKLSPHVLTRPSLPGGRHVAPSARGLSRSLSPSCLHAQFDR